MKLQFAIPRHIDEAKRPVDRDRSMIRGVYIQTDMGYIAG